jgi:hypothetical protein
VGQGLVVDPPAGGAQLGDGQAVVLGNPGDDRVGDEGEAPGLFRLLVTAPAADGAFAGVEQVGARGVEVLALFSWRLILR